MAYLKSHSTADDVDYLVAGSGLGVEEEFVSVLRKRREGRG